MQRRPFLRLAAAAALALPFTGAFAPHASAEDGPKVKIGVLHSLSGTMAISETSLRDVVLMAAEEINEAGGVEVGGESHMIEPVVVDPASDWPLFAEKAKELIDQDVAAIFGCWTSVSRKSVLPVIEEENALLFYPVQYEGEEQSLNVFYTAASPNQQLVPAAQYAIDELGSKKFYLLGTDYVFPRTANKVLKAFLLKEGVPEENIMEEYTPFHHQDYQTIVSKIKQFGASGDAVVLSTINGDSNVPFYTEFANQGLTSSDVPIIAFSVAEDELRSMDTSKLVGHLAAWNYFQSLPGEANEAFVEAFKAYCQENNLPGGDARVTGDPIEAAYYGVYVWKMAAEKADSFDVDKVREAVYGMEFEAPGGTKKMHESNQHTYKPVYIGEIRADGQFDIVWESDGLVEPDSYSSLLHSPEELAAIEPTGGPKK
ncbi:urea ABC transporter substrate-binding protein [Phycisphaera mikurensis]|uniref:Putative urea ABC transporter substrate binding protein n=1 Tax=Phycisphaera mikurensis (strain NBRC 102666 / KCTC 22515 / FYK2301M01) TaxID=1142394 RepID=I0IDP1_PHYMF|nr:urea ABC transporter substrate-binding protein [Phycisphaera mikurensis]MBB6441196.1 urea transport system substrate-binding protein [Phycisphaera mikurensis]BAM03379.1 putative urea ABC transporter substrate binding protein [Phycisphaera mikurensis NBRC 102666]